MIPVQGGGVLAKPWSTVGYKEEGQCIGLRLEILVIVWLFA